VAPGNARRPRFPDRHEYGPGEEPPLEWETVAGWLEGSRYYWLSTTRPDGRPYAVPVWAVWTDGGAWFTSSPETVSAGNLAANPYAVLHTDDATEVAIVQGSVERPAPSSVPDAVVTLYEAKYGWRLSPDDPGMPHFALRPRRVLAWRSSDVRGTSRSRRFGEPSS
jgi:hypothetical protein